MRALLATLVLVAAATPAVAHQSADRPSYISGQSRSTLTIYTSSGLQGVPTTFTRGQGHVSGGERASSLRATGGAWQVCDGANFQGQCRVVEGWTMNLNDLGLRRVRSFRPILPDDASES